MRKPVFGVFDQVSLKPSRALIRDIDTRSIIVSRQRIIQELHRLQGCTGYSAPLLFTYGINMFSHDVALLCVH